MRGNLLALGIGIVLLAGCGGDDEQEAAAPPADATRLQVEITGTGPNPVEMQLVCAGRCDVERVRSAIAGAQDETRACTQQYGGPEKATVKGTFKGEPVDAQFSRENGCEIARWEDAAPLLEEAQ